MSPFHRYLLSSLAIAVLGSSLLLASGDPPPSTTATSPTPARGKYCVHEGMCAGEDKGSYSLLKSHVCVGNECGVEWSGPRFVAILLVTAVVAGTVGCCWWHWSSRRGQGHW